MPPEKLQELSNILEHLAPKTLFNIGPVSITTTVTNTLIIDAVLIFLVFLATRNLSYIPKGIQVLLEMGIKFIHGLIDPNMGKEGRKFTWLFATLCLFIAFMNLSWFIPGMIPPVTDASTTFALGAATILTVHFLTIRGKGVKHYVNHYLGEAPMMAPLTLIEELMKPFTLGIRLFGNMFGEKMVTTAIFILVPLFAPILVMALGLIMGLIQAYVFTLLAVTYLTILYQGH